jgi:hypothetical protein
MGYGLMPLFVTGHVREDHRAIRVIGVFKDFKAIRDFRVIKAIRVFRVFKGMKEFRDFKVFKDIKGIRAIGVIRDFKATKGIKGIRVIRDTKAVLLVKAGLWGAMGGGGVFGSKTPSPAFLLLVIHSVGLMLMNMFVYLSVDGVVRDKFKIRTNSEFMVI